MKEFIQDDLFASSLLVNEGSSKISIHHDPPAPLYAAVAGPTVWEEVSPGKWERACGGGRTFFADSVLSLEYGPRDLLIMNGNVPHGITNLKQINSKMPSKGNQLERFSLVLFSRFGREHMKQHGNHSDDFQQAWARQLQNKVSARVNQGCRPARSTRSAAANQIYYYF